MDLTEISSHKTVDIIPVSLKDCREVKKKSQTKTACFGKTSNLNILNKISRIPQNSFSNGISFSFETDFKLL